MRFGRTIAARHSRGGTRPVVGQRITGLAFHEQGHELANLCAVETGMQGLDNTSDVGSGAIGVVGRYPRNHLADLGGFVRLHHDLNVQRSRAEPLGSNGTSRTGRLAPRSPQRGGTNDCHHSDCHHSDCHHPERFLDDQ